MVASQSEARFEDVMNARPTALEGWRSKAQALAHKGRFDKAADTFSELLKRDPSSTGVRLDLASSLIRAGKFVQAEALLRSGLGCPTRRQKLVNNYCCFLVKIGVLLRVKKMCKSLCVSSVFHSRDSRTAAILGKEKFGCRIFLGMPPC